MIFNDSICNVVTNFFHTVSYRLITFVVIPKIFNNMLIPVKSSDAITNNLYDIVLRNGFNIRICNFSSVFSFYNVLKMQCVHVLPLNISYRCYMFCRATVLSLIAM